MPVEETYTADRRAFEAGLDALEAPAPPPRPGPGAVFVRSVLPPLVAVAAFVAFWQLAFSAGLKPSYALPCPLEVLATFAEMVRDGRAWEAISISVSRGALGFVASLAVGTALGLAMWRSRWLRAALGPFVSGLQSLPSIAWVPAAIIWFGLTDAAIYAVVLLGAVPSIANGLLAGFDQVPPLLGKVGRMLGLGTLGRIWHVLLPAALPGYLAGLKQGWAFSWRSLMAAELITYSPLLGIGLGQQLNIGRELRRDGSGDRLDLPDPGGRSCHRAARFRASGTPRAPRAGPHRGSLIRSDNIRGALNGAVGRVSRRE